jgi:hypothetical protein
MSRSRHRGTGGEFRQQAVRNNQSSARPLPHQREVPAAARAWFVKGARVRPNAPRVNPRPWRSLRVPRSPMNGRAGTNVQIDSITVNTRATDPNGIAADINGALRRKLLVSSTDGGLA